MNRQFVLGLGRHPETEVSGGGASPGTQYLFSSMEEQLRRHFTLIRIPSYYYSTDVRRSLRVAVDVLKQADACLFGMAGPFDLHPFFALRDRTGTQTPFVYMPLGEFPRGGWTYRSVHQYLRPQDLVLFSSRADRAIHDALVASTPARVAVVPFGIDPRFFRAPAGMRQDTRRHFGVDDDEVVLVYHGRVTAAKNVHGAIMMFRRIARERPGSRTCLWIVGELPGAGPREFGPFPLSHLPASQLTDAFRELLRDTGLDERVLFWGSLPREAIPRVLSAADIAINLTLNEDENFGYSTVEAMAAGLPVIGTDWGGLKDTIEDGVTGVLVPTLLTSIGVAMDHWSAWRGALRLVEDRDMRRRMRAAAERRAAEVFDIERLVDVVAGEIRAQITSKGTRPEVPHVWTGLGKRLSRTYSTEQRGNGHQPVPTRVPASEALFRDHPLMRHVVKPYASETSNTRPGRDAVFFLATELVQVRGTTIVSKDPRYLFKLAATSAPDRAVIRILRARGFCHRSDFAAAARHVDARSLHASLKRLLRAGVVLQSRKAPPARES